MVMSSPRLTVRLTLTDVLQHLAGGPSSHYHQHKAETSTITSYRESLDGATEQ